MSITCLKSEEALTPDDQRFFPQRRWLMTVFSVLVFSMLGCSQPMEASRTSSFAGDAAVAESASSRGDFGGENGQVESFEKATQSSEQDFDRQNGSNVSRRIIQNGRISLIARDFDDAVAQAQQLIKQHEGFLASDNTNMSSRERRIANWTIRVPYANFDPLYAALQDVAEPVQANRDAQDVTARYIDLEARIASKKKLEQRVLQLLDRPDDKIQHVIEVEKELSRIRTDIESMEGQLRYLSDQVSLSTLEITIEEQKDYVPPQAPGFESRVSEQWSGSVTSLLELGEWLVLSAVALAPWVAVLIVLLAVLWVGLRLRKLFRRSPGNSTTPPAAPPATSHAG